MYKTGNNITWSYQSKEEREEAQRRIDASKLPTDPRKKYTLRPQADDGRVAKMDSPNRIPIGLHHGLQMQDSPTSGQYTPQSNVPTGGVFTPKDLLHLEHENEDLRSLAEERGRRLEMAELRNVELQEQVEAMQLAFEAMRRTSVPIGQASTTAIPAIQEHRCQDYGNPKHHDDTFVCYDSNHPADRGKVSCSTCTQLALRLVDAEDQVVYSTGGVSLSVCAGCAEPVTNPCDCYTKQRCATCTENLVSRMTEAAKANGGRFLFACLYCKADLSGQGQIVQQCATCGGKKG